MNTPGYSVFAFRGVEPHLPLNPKERVRGADPLVDEKGRKYCRITIVCYINENLFCRRDANDQPFPLASDIPQVVGMSSTEATYYKTYTHDGHGFWGVPLGKALVKLETLETGDLGIAQTRLNKRIDTLQQSRLASALFIERERAMIDYYRDLDATSTNPNVRVPVVETFANETIEERLRCRSYRDAWGDVCSLADALTPETLFLGTPKGTIWLARIERQKKLGASFIHELPKSRVDGGDDEGDVMDVAEKGPVFVQVGARLGEIVEEIEAARVRLFVVAITRKLTRAHAGQLYRPTPTHHSRTTTSRWMMSRWRMLKRRRTGLRRKGLRRRVLPHVR